MKFNFFFFHQSTDFKPRRIRGRVISGIDVLDSNSQVCALSFFIFRSIFLVCFETNDNDNPTYREQNIENRVREVVEDRGGSRGSDPLETLKNAPIMFFFFCFFRVRRGPHLSKRSRNRQHSVEIDWDQISSISGPRICKELLDFFENEKKMSWG